MLTGVGLTIIFQVKPSLVIIVIVPVFVLAFGFTTRVNSARGGRLWRINIDSCSLCRRTCSCSQGDYNNIALPDRKTLTITLLTVAIWCL